MIEIINKTEFLPNEDLLKKITSRYTKKDIELIITDNNEIQNINKTYRNIDKPTDVLSFPLNGSKKEPLGSIVISIDFVKKVSDKFSHTQQDEFTLLFIHGLLHLLGYDHEIDNGEMRKEEEKLIKMFNLPKSLIIRNED
jgi:probable rRNA maturation factor